MLTHNRDWEKSSGQATQFNIRSIWAIDRTSAQPQVHLSLWICCTVILWNSSLWMYMEQTLSCPKVFLSSKPAAQYWIFPSALENSIRETFNGTEFRGFSVFQKETFHWKNEKLFKARCKTRNLWMTRPNLTAALIFWYILWFKFWEEKNPWEKINKWQRRAVWLSKKIIRIRGNFTETCKKLD